MDPSAALLWLMAVATVVVASLWAGSDFMQEVKSAGRVADDEVTPPTWLLIRQKQFLQKVALFVHFLAALVLGCLGYPAMTVCFGCLFPLRGAQAFLARDGTSSQEVPKEHEYGLTGS